ncbi:MAG: hypothetical protein KDA87_08155, partial [Planctomycetales bacterium]|nr:hypothetical protein [Planctomycetales bacterium]
LEYLVRLKIRSTFGDANLDNRFNSSDLVQVFEAGEYEDGIAGNSTWQTGDWNGDGEFDSSDLVFALQFAGYEASADQVLVYAFRGDVTTTNLADNSLQLDVLPSLPEAEFGSQNNRFSSQNIAVSPEGQIARLALRTDDAFPAADLFVYNASGSLLSRSTFAEFGTVQFSPDGTLFVLHPHSIQRYAVSGSGELASLGTFPAQNSNLWNPQTAFGSDGYIYLANFYSNSTGERRLTRYDAQTGQLDPNFMVPIWLDKMKFASNGLLYTAFSNTQQVVDTSTGSVSSLGPFTSDSISSFELGRDDEVLVLSYWFDDASGQYRSAVDRYSISTNEHLGRMMTLDGIQGDIEYWPG